MNMKSGQMRRHAQILRARDETPMAQAQADLIEARAELADAEAGRDATVAEHARMVEEVPILGHITREGGKIISIERPWTQADIDAMRALGIDIAWQFCHDPAAGLRQGELIHIWIGTRAAGPRVQWDRETRTWVRLVSRGNYGGNWACGGNWGSEPPRYQSLRSAAPDLDAAVQKIKENHENRG